MALFDKKIPTRHFDSKDLNYLLCWLTIAIDPAVANRVFRGRQSQDDGCPSARRHAPFRTEPGLRRRCRNRSCNRLLFVHLGGAALKEPYLAKQGIFAYFPGAGREPPVKWSASSKRPVSPKENSNEDIVF